MRTRVSLPLVQSEVFRALNKGATVQLCAAGPPGQPMGSPEATASGGYLTLQAAGFPSGHRQCHAARRTADTGRTEEGMTVRRRKRGVPKHTGMDMRGEPTPPPSVDDLRFTKCGTQKPEPTRRSRGTRTPNFKTSENGIFGNSATRGSTKNYHVPGIQWCSVIVLQPFLTPRKVCF